MIKKFTLIILTCFLSTARVNSQSLQTFHDFWGVTILGDTISFSQWAGKKLLVVNTASFCSYTPQFAGLQALDSTYQNNNFEVIGFPSNDFGSQDPGEDSVINNFCTGVYGVQFQMMSKVGIRLPDTAECYKWLQWQYLNGVANAPVTWNFNKYCIDEAGGWVAHYQSSTSPFDTAIVNWILTAPVATEIAGGDRSFEVLLLNNPSQENFRLRFHLQKASRLNIKLLNMAGKEIGSEIRSLDSGSRDISLDYNVPDGVYFIKIDSGNFQRVIKAIRL